MPDQEIPGCQRSEEDQPFCHERNSGFSDLGGQAMKLQLLQRWAMKKKTPTYWLVNKDPGILIMLYHNPHITIGSAIPYIPSTTMFVFQRFFSQKHICKVHSLNLATKSLWHLAICALSKKRSLSPTVIAISQHTFFSFQVIAFSQTTSNV